MKFIESRIANNGAQTVAVDLGARRALGNLSLGVAAQNIGPGMKFADEVSPLPLTMALGAAYRLPLGLTIAADVKNRPNAHTSEFSLGTEYSFIAGFAIRAGYGSARALNNGSGGLAALNGMAAGFGYKTKGYSLDYSITPFGELGNVQRFSLGARF